MVRGKVHLKRIQNPVNRRVTFSKRKGGMLKKAEELSLLCDAEIGLLIFSQTGKLYEFAKPSMDRLLWKYEKYFGFTEDNLRLSHQLETLRLEVENLRKGIIHLEQMCKHMIGEDLELLDSTELQRLDKKLILGVTKIHSRREKMLLGHIQSLKLKEKTLEVENANLVKKIGGSHLHIDINSNLETESATPQDHPQHHLNLTLS